MHVAEVLVSHGASLNAKTFLEETPIGIITPQHSYQYTCWWGLRKQRFHFQLVQSMHVLPHALVQADFNLVNANLRKFVIFHVSIYIFGNLDCC